MVKGFSRTQIALHWAVAVLIIYQLLMGDDMTALYWAVRRGGTVAISSGAWIHIIAGVAVLALALWRLVLHVTRGVPPAPADDSPLMALAGRLGHWALYALMIGMPVTGLAAWYGGIALSAELHGGILKALLWVLIAGHVAAAFYHHFILKDGLLNRMRKPLD
jgi:cytochrome b561